VLKLQVFLSQLEGFTDLPITGVFDQATYEAVGIFQERYFSDVLEPWGHSEETHFVYILTKKKVNEIVCQRAFPINLQQAQEISQFRAFLESLRASGVPVSEIPTTSEPVNTEGPVSSGILSPNGEEFVMGEKNGATTSTATTATSSTGFFGRFDGLQSVASAVFSLPRGWDETVNALVILLAIILAVYLAARALVERLSRNTIIVASREITRKTLVFIAGLVIAVTACFLFGYYVVILPLLVLIVALAAYLLYVTLTKKEDHEVITFLDSSKEN
jgi:hypothetical protein